MPLLLLLVTILTGIIFFLPHLPLFSSSGDLAPVSGKKAPEGMVYIPGGYAVIGSKSDDPEAFPGEKPARKVFVKGFFIDRYEITNRDFQKCVEAGGCTQFKNIRHPLYRDSLGPRQPAVPLSWKRAYDYCLWAGKRLPTEAEWEKVARGGERGTIYPWGNDPPSCLMANYKGCSSTTRPVGSYPPGHYGVYDMAGNGYEWVNDWATHCREGCGTYSCGSECGSKDPRGPCSGRFPCGGMKMKIMKGGSWWWPSTQIRGSWRRIEKIESGGHRLSARCASDTEHLTSSPGWMVKKPPERPGDPPPPTLKQLEIFHDIRTDRLNKTICARKWTSPAHCKDPESYVMSNERLLYLFAPYIRNLGGGYTGVAADANYTFIAHAGSRWAWLFDFDKNIISLHKIIKALVMKSLTPEIFARRFHPRREKSTMEIIRAAYGNDPDFEQIKFVFHSYGSKLYPYYRKKLTPDKNFRDFGWLRNRNAYRYIRLMFLQNRISITPGDMLKEKTMISIARAAKKLEIPIRIYYPSNAEEFWKFSAVYKRNILALPLDQASVIISTLHEFPWHEKMTGARFWHYFVRGGENFQRKLRLKDYYTLDHFRYERLFPYRGKEYFSTIHLPTELNAGLKEKVYGIRKMGGEKTSMTNNP